MENTEFEKMTNEELIEFAKAKALEATEKANEAEANKKLAEDATAEAKNLKDKLTDEKSKQGGLHTCKVDGKTYVFVAPKFSVPGETQGEDSTTWEAEKAKKNAELCKKLVEMKSGVLVLSK
ncbi:hypothetical protein [Emticicia sp. W12TSBA100-4]|uniref:hypothetical protein n=1 Tax=Emticicia sp. W12TSBA100-4 TaxID=3160965 RepID=UPI0033062535